MSGSVPIKNNRWLILLLMPFMLSQCEKMNRDMPFIIGNGDPDIIVQETDSVLQFKNADQYPFYNPETVEISLDFDKDGKEDIRLSNTSYWNKWGIESNSYITIADQSFEIAVLQKADTIFFCGLSDTINYPYKEYYYCFYYTRPGDFICQYDSGISSIATKRYPQTFHYGDTLPDEPEWVSDTTITLLTYKDDSRWELDGEYETYWDIKTGIELFDPEQYIAVRKEEDDRYYYGWIKIGTNGEPFIRLREIAIEKIK